MFFAFYVHHLSPFLIQFNEQVGIRWYGLAYIAGFIGAFYLMKWLARKRIRLTAGSQVADFVFYAALFGVLIGGRLGYVLFYRPSMLTEDPLGIFRVWDGGMASHGGILGLSHFQLRSTLTGIGFPGPESATIWWRWPRLGSFSAVSRISSTANCTAESRNVPWAVQFPAELLDHPDEAALVIQQTTKINPALDNVPEIIAAARHSAAGS